MMIFGKVMTTIFNVFLHMLSWFTYDQIETQPWLCLDLFNPIECFIS